MKDCDITEVSLERWLDGELDARESESIRTHVAACARCRETQRQLQAIEGVLKSALLAEAQKIEFSSFWRALKLRIGGKDSRYASAIEWLRSIFTASRTAWAIPILIALLLAIFSLESYMPGWRDSRNSFATVESIDTYGRSVALLRQNESKTTVIWLYEDEESENEAPGDPAKSAPAF